jgi:hypothetical protein
MRCKSKPCLKEKSDNACPVKEQTPGEMLLHIMPPDVVYNEWKGVQKSEDEEGVGDPTVKYLESFV